MTFEDVVRIRTRAGWSRRQLADYVGVTVDTIRSWESAPDDPHHRRVQKWHAKALRRVEAMIFRGENPLEEDAD